VPIPTPDGVESLDDDACRSLLGSARIGRLGYTRGALPAIAPVPFVVHAGEVVIPSRSCSPLVSGTSGAVVAFQADSLDPATCTGWTVTVVGASRSVTAPAEVAALDALPWPAPVALPDRCYISVTIGLVSGWWARSPRDVSVAEPADDVPRRLADRRG
jgi:hypothetical protein